MVFLPRELEATHSAPVSNSSGVTRTFRTLRTLCGSWSCSLAYKEGDAVQGWGGCWVVAAEPAQGWTRAWEAATCLLTVPSTLQTMLGRGCPDASQDRFSTEFSFTHIFLSLSAIHGDPVAGRGRVRQQTLPACQPPPHQGTPGQRVAFGPQRA